MLRIESQRLRARAGTALERVRELSRDEALRADCAVAVASIRNNGSPVKSGSVAGVVAVPGVVAARVARTDTLQ